MLLPGRGNDRLKKLIGAFLLFAASLALIAAIINTAHPRTNIISWFVMDINHDLKEELLVITGSGKVQTLDTGEKYGDHLTIYSDFKLINNTPVFKGEPDAIFDLSDIKPFRVQAGDIDGDGEVELSVSVYKTAKFHPVLAKRPFFYSLKDGELQPVWLGSRLARPFAEYILSDVDEDGIDEIVSIEWMDDGKQVVALYDWKGFGFEVKTVSGELQGEVTFLTDINRRQDGILIDMAGETYQLQLNGSEIEFIKN